MYKNNSNFAKFVGLNTEGEEFASIVLTLSSQYESPHNYTKYFSVILFFCSFPLRPQAA